MTHFNGRIDNLYYTIIELLLTIDATILGDV